MGGPDVAVVELAAPVDDIGPVALLTVGEKRWAAERFSQVYGGRLVTVHGGRGETTGMTTQGDSGGPIFCDGGVSERRA